MQEQQHITPPPSPFASYFQGSENSQGEDGPQARDSLQVDVSDSALTDSGVGSSLCRILDQLRAVSGQGSPSTSPDTPSAVEQKQMLALSRNGSAMSDPLLAELLHCKLLSCKGQASLEEQLGMYSSK